MNQHREVWNEMNFSAIRDRKIKPSEFDKKGINWLNVFSAIGFVLVFIAICAALLIQTAALAAEKTTPDSEIKAMRFCDVGSDGVCIEGCLFVSGSVVEHSVTVFQQKEDQALLGGGDNLKPHNKIGGNSAENSTKEAREKVVDTNLRDFISTLVGIAIGLFFAWLVINKMEGNW